MVENHRPRRPEIHRRERRFAMNPYSILLVEDDDSLSEIIAETLERYDFAVHRCEAYESIGAAVQDEKPGVVLIDINLPRYDGFTLCSRIREVSTVPIIFLSARDASMDIVMAHSVGGDDYLTKPFDMQVLMAKINAQLRRAYGYSETERTTIVYHDMVLDLTAGTLEFRGTKEQLTRNELRLAGALMRRPSEIVTRDELTRALWDDAFVEENTLSVNINRVRTIFGRIGTDAVIRTVRGSGYCLE